MLAVLERAGVPLAQRRRYLYKRAIDTRLGKLRSAERDKLYADLERVVTDSGIARLYGTIDAALVWRRALLPRPRPPKPRGRPRKQDTRDNPHGVDFLRGTMIAKEWSPAKGRMVSREIPISGIIPSGRPPDRWYGRLIRGLVAALDSVSPAPLRSGLLRRALDVFFGIKKSREALKKDLQRISPRN